MLQKYPNFIVAIDSIKADTNLKLISSGDNKIKYSMPLVAFNNKLGDIAIELIEFNNKKAIIVFYTLNGKKIKAETQSEFITNDLTVENWLQIINEIMIKHISNPDHQAVAMNFLNSKLSYSENKSSGCIIVLVIITIITLIIYFS